MRVCVRALVTPGACGCVWMCEDACGVHADMFEAANTTNKPQTNHKQTTNKSQTNHKQTTSKPQANMRAAVVRFARSAAHMVLVRVAHRQWLARIVPL